MTMKEELMKVVTATNKIQKNLDTIRSTSTACPPVKTSPPAPGLEAGGGLHVLPLDTLDTWHVLPLDTLDTWHVLPLDTLDDLVARFILPVPETYRADYNR